jgi:DNA-binding transcriptional MocR family regulator
MTPAEQAEFIALWNAGMEITAIAQALHIPKGTVQSRAHRLQARGLIQPRPKGGAYQRQRAKAGLTYTRAETRAIDRHQSGGHHEVMNSYFIIHEGTSWPKRAAR